MLIPHSNKSRENRTDLISLLLDFGELLLHQLHVLAVAFDLQLGARVRCLKSNRRSSRNRRRDDFLMEIILEGSKIEEKEESKKRRERVYLELLLEVKELFLALLKLVAELLLIFIDLNGFLQDGIPISLNDNMHQTRSRAFCWSISCAVCMSCFSTPVSLLSSAVRRAHVVRMSSIVLL